MEGAPRRQGTKTLKPHPPNLPNRRVQNREPHADDPLKTPASPFSPEQKGVATGVSCFMAAIGRGRAEGILLPVLRSQDPAADIPRRQNDRIK